jgi:hypothetical protein
VGEPNAAGVLVPQCVEAGGGHRLLFAQDALHFNRPSIAHWGEQHPVET